MAEPTVSIPVATPAAATPAVQVAPVAATEPTPTIRVKSHQRAARVKAQLAEEPADKAAAEPEAKTEPDAPVAETKPTPQSTEVTDARAERAKRIAAVQAREAANRQKQQQEQQARGHSGELEKLRKRLSELEPLESVFSSEGALLEAAEKKGMSSEKLVQWMRTRLSDPAAVAQKHSQTVEDRMRAEIEKVRAEARAEREAVEAKYAQIHEQREGEARAAKFLSAASEKASSHPMTAQFMKARGPEHLVALASQVIVPYLPENYDIENLHDHLEQYLEYVSVGAIPAASGQALPPQKTNGAAKPVTTLSNALGSVRESVTEDTPLAKMSRKDRVAFIKRQLDKSG